jgi:hypothetical protein
MNEALNKAVHERFRFIEGRLYWLQFIRFFRGPFNVQMLHIPALGDTYILCTLPPECLLFEPVSIVPA